MLNGEQDKRPIAYLAPEIPGPSSTFVYNEIIEIENFGVSVRPYSLHTVKAMVGDTRLSELAQCCEYLYAQSPSSLFKANVNVFWQSPRKYIGAFIRCNGDAIKCLSKPRIAAGLMYRFFVAGVLAHRLLKENVRHLHCHFSHIATDVGMYAALQSGTPFSFTAHANDIFERGYLLREKGARAKFVATISDFNIKYLMNAGIVADKLKLVRCGVDIEKFAPRTPVAKKQEVATIGFLGRLVEKKGVDLLVSAIRLLLDSGAHVHLQIMGEGPLEPTLREQVKTLRLEEHVTFGGALPHHQVSTWFEHIDYFVFPGKMDSNGDMDGIPVVLMEAMMRGVPVVATRVSGIPELVRRNETGYIASPDPEELANALLTALSESEEEKASKIWRAINLVKTEFNLAHNAKLLFHYICADKAERECQTSLPC